MKLQRRLAVAAILIAAASSQTPRVRAQSSAVGQNVNIVTGSGDQFIGDMFRQRQNEPAIGISSINPLHMMAAYNDYRTVDYVADAAATIPPSPIRTTIAKILDFFRAPWKRDREERGEAEADSAQAWIGLSFTDDGTNWYTGLLPGHPFDPAQTPPLFGYEAASDPVIAVTPNQMFLAGIAFTPNGPSTGFVSRFTDRNRTASGQNIELEWTKLLIKSSDLPPTTSSFFVDKPSIAAGPNGHVYAAFVVFDQTDPSKLSSRIIFFASSNYGETWSSGTVVSLPLTRNQSPWILVDPNNENTVYIGWRLFSSPALPNLTNAIVGRKSTNGGQTFTPSIPYPVALLLKAYDVPQMPLTTTSFQSPRSNAYPTAAIDGNGAIHVAIQEYVYPSNYPLAALRGLPLGPGASPSTGVPRITVTSSTDGGATWTLRKAVDLGPGAGAQFMPALTAAGEPGPSCGTKPGPSSRVMLMYYDARASGIGTNPGGTGYVAGGDKQFDVRIAQASACAPRDAAGRLVFSASEQLSRYTLSATPPHGIVTTPGYGYAAVNRPYSMFCGGGCGFSGDYIHLGPRVPYVRHPTTGAWTPTTAASADPNTLPAPVAVGAWADTRDAVLPTFPPNAFRTNVPASATLVDRLPWDVYQQPGTGLTPCVNPGARDQNVYLAQYTPGQLYAGAPETFRSADIPHSYPLFVENRSGETRFFRLSIDANASASFDYRSFDASTGTPLDKEADIVVKPYSSVTGAVVIGPGQNNPVFVSVVQLAATTDSSGNVVSTGAILAGGARTTVTLRTAGEALTPPTETHAPVVAPVPVVTKPMGQLPPGGILAPFTQTPFTQTTYAQNPFSQTPFTQTTAVYDVTDYSFDVTSAGSDAAAFAALLSVQNALQLRGSYLFQVLINRISSTTALNGCIAVDQPVETQVSNIVAPFTQTPFTQTPFTQTPFTQTPFTQTPFTQTPFTQTPFTQTSDPRDPTISNSTFYIAPPGTSPSGYRAARPVTKVVYTLRAFQIKASNDPTFVSIAPNDQPQLGVTVAAETPNVIVVDGVPQFDPAGPPVSSGGTAVPVRLAFVTQPTRTVVGATMTPVRVAIQDGFGNTLTGAPPTAVTLAFGSNPSEGTLSGTLTRQTVEGVATFADLSINAVGTGYTLVASAPNVTSATSQSFDVVAAPIVIGVANNGNCYPFMCNDSGASEGPSIHYQQVFAASAFTGTTPITSLTFFQIFATRFGGTTTVLSGNYRISLSTTTRAVNGLSIDLASNIGADNATIFNGNLGGVSTTPSFTINAATPFVYNPASGNLLLDIVVTDQPIFPNRTGINGYLDADTSATSTTRAYAFLANGTGIVDTVGLVTQFNK